MGNRCGGNGKDNKYKNLRNNKLTNMLDFIFFCLIILITVAEAVGIWACAWLIWMAIYFFVFSPRMGLKFCLSFLNRYFDV